MSRYLGVKIKTPPIETEELGRLYDLIFSPDAFFASWAGRVGHYAYGSKHQMAVSQDGYLYLWPRTNSYWGPDGNFLMTADPSIAKTMCGMYVEIDPLTLNT
jgi:hypothetical protein